jgi:hypothetical protein
MRSRLKAHGTPTVVEARFEEDGSLTPLAFVWRGARLPVASQGRAWTTGEGDDRRRHYLVMTAGGVTFELAFAPGTLHWWVVPVGGRAALV